MPSGLEVYDEAGRLILSPSSSVGRILKIFPRSNVRSGSFEYPGWGTIFVSAQIFPDAAAAQPFVVQDGYRLDWSRSGNTVTWELVTLRGYETPVSSSHQFRVIAGVF